MTNEEKLNEWAERSYHCDTMIPLSAQEQEWLKDMQQNLESLSDEEWDCWLKQKWF